MTKDEALKHHADKYGLTLDQFRMMCESASEMYEGQGMNSVDYALAREAYFAGFTKACKEALEQPAQEPVAHIKQGMDGYPKLVFNGKFEYESIAAKWDDIALYTHPAPSWQGLSDDEINYASYGNTQSDGFCDGAKWAEQALKEKNND